jgi:hypothetical protein
MIESSPLAWLTIIPESVERSGTPIASSLCVAGDHAMCCGAEPCGPRQKYGAVQGVRIMADQVVTNQEKILANQAKILANQDKILANQGRLESNQGKLDKVLSNQERVLGNQEKILAKK